MPQVSDALRVPPGAGQRVAEVVLRLREVRIAPHGRLVVGQRFRRAFQEVQRHAEIQVGLGVVRFLAQRFLQKRNGLPDATDRDERSGEVVSRGEEARAELQRRLVLADGCVHAAGFRQRGAKAGVRPGVGGSLRYGVRPEGDFAAVVGIALQCKHTQPGRRPVQVLGKKAPERRAAGADRGHSQRHQWHKSQIHPVLDDPLCHPGHERGRGEDREEPRAEQPDGRFPPAREQGAGNQRDDDARLQPHFRQAPDPKCAVVKDEGHRPECQPQVMRERGKLRERVIPPRDGDADADRAAAIAARAGQQTPEQEPGRRQRRVISAPLPPGVRETAGYERAVEQQHQHWCGNHVLLRRHAQQTRGDREHLPAARCWSVHAAYEAIEREQIEQPHERLGALHDVGHPLGLQRMQRPQGRHRERDGHRGLAETPAKRRLGQRAPHQPKQRQAGERVDDDVCRVIAAHVEAAGGKVERQGQVQNRPAANREAAAKRCQDIRERPKVPQREVLDDRVLVIVDERPGQAVRIGRKDGEDECGAREGDAPAR